jgi:predicted ATPase
MFLNLINPVVPEPEFLTVNGRLLQVPSSAKGIAKFTFKDLCENVIIF